MRMTLWRWQLIFQQTIASSHASKSIRKWFKYNNTPLLERPWSTYINIVENTWNSKIDILIEMISNINSLRISRKLVTMPRQLYPHYIYQNLFQVKQIVWIALSKITMEKHLIKIACFSTYMQSPYNNDHLNICDKGFVMFLNKLLF